MVSPLPFFFCNSLVKWLFFGAPGPFWSSYYRQIQLFLDNNNKQTMYITTNKYQTQLISSLIINNLHYNFIILNNKLIFTHKINTDLLTKLLHKHYYKFKLYK